MAVVFGDKTTDDGWLRVTCIQWQMDSHENGYSVDAKDIPDYPTMPSGKRLCRCTTPSANEWRFDETDVPLTKEQILEELVEAIRELTQCDKE
jgi:hypothetical protein